MRENNLSPTMQARLDKWKKTAPPAPSHPVYISKGDYLDSIRDIEDREAKQWQEHLNKNPYMRGK